MDFFIAGFIGSGFVHPVVSFWRDFGLNLCFWHLCYFCFSFIRSWSYSGSFISFAFNIVADFFTLTLLRLIKEKLEKKQIQKIFSQYVSQEVIEELLNNPEKIKLGGEERFLSVLFCDLRNFTNISEKLTPKQLTEFLNQYFNVMTDLIIDNRGVLDKYIGDAIMAFYGAPLRYKNHAFSACQAALNMVSALKEHKPKWETVYKIKLSVGIGINSGKVVVGNMGSSKRFDYTVMGDNVNLASRLEGATKKYGCSIIISGSTYKQIKNKFLCRYLDLVALKGKEKGVNIYELVGSKSVKFNNKAELTKKIKLFHQGIRCYRLQKWQAARKIFKMIIKLFPDDKPSKIYLKRCSYYLNNPPGNYWDGIHRLKKK
ncbi:MAG: hypothetical protein GF332_03055 [Candidatus Moranbacteria bacterium]|nr:hypothetical protein [Candidatus Moranbacteria bacterium]